MRLACIGRMPSPNGEPPPAIVLIEPHVPADYTVAGISRYRDSHLSQLPGRKSVRSRCSSRTAIPVYP